MNLKRCFMAVVAVVLSTVILRRARRLLPALAAILIPASVLSKKSAMLSGRHLDRARRGFLALVSVSIRA